MRQRWQATTGTNFTKPRPSISSRPNTFEWHFQDTVFNQLSATKVGSLLTVLTFLDSSWKLKRCCLCTPSAIDCRPRRNRPTFWKRCTRSGERGSRGAFLSFISEDDDMIERRMMGGDRRLATLRKTTALSELKEGVGEKG